MILNVSHCVQQGMCQSWENQADSGQGTAPGKRQEMRKVRTFPHSHHCQFGDNKSSTVKEAEDVAIAVLVICIYHSMPF